MIEYSIIGSVAIIQYLVYSILDKKKVEFPKWVLHSIMLLGQVFIFPQLLILAYSLGNKECGMPILAVHMFFLFFGGSLNILVYFIYYLKSRLNKTA